MRKVATMSDVTLDFSGASTEADLWAEIQRKLCPGFEKFGANLDALVDVLRGGFGVATPLRLRISGKIEAAAAAGNDRWLHFEEIFADSVKGDYSEEVESIEWV